MRPDEGDGADRSRAILYLHGGAYVLGSRRTHRGLAAQIALAGNAPVHLLDYRLGRRHKRPAALEDSVAAYRDLLGWGSSRVDRRRGRFPGAVTSAMAMRLRARGYHSGWSGRARRLARSDLGRLGVRQHPPRRRAVPGLDGARRRALSRRRRSPRSAALAGRRRSQRAAAHLPPGRHPRSPVDDRRRLPIVRRAAGVDMRLTRFEGMWHDSGSAAGLLREADEAMAPTSPSHSMTSGPGGSARRASCGRVGRRLGGHGRLLRASRSSARASGASASRSR